MSERVSTELLIRSMVLTDLEQVLVWRNHPEVRRYMYTQHEITLEEHSQWFERSCFDKYRHVLIVESAYKPIGLVNFTKFPQGDIADWGFYTVPESPKGSGRKACHAALDHAFKELKLQKVCGRALAYNEQSIRIHQKLGFQQEGVLRNQYFDGEHYHHILCFGLMADEWQAQSFKN